MDNLYLLSEDDLAVLRDVIQIQRDRSLTTINRPAIELETTESPEVYVCVAPVGGIPARVGMLPGVSASCTVYRASGIESGPIGLSNAGFDQVYVCNLSLTAVTAGTPVLVTRDKFGTWFTGGEAVGGGSVIIVDGNGVLVEGTSNCSNGLAKLRPTECLLATISYLNQTVRLRPTHPANGLWTSEADVTYPGGSGPMTFWYSGGRIHLALDAAGTGFSGELLNCGDGCFSGGPLTGHAWPEDLELKEETGTGTHEGTGTGTGDERTPCTGYTFKVCLSCMACPVISTPCTEVVCPGNSIPDKLYLTVHSANCPGFNFTTTLTYDPANGWKSPLLVLASPFPFQAVYARMFCFVNSYFLLEFFYNNWSGNGLNDIEFSQSKYPVSGTFHCDPFYLASGMSNPGTSLESALCSGSWDVTFSITE